MLARKIALSAAGFLALSALGMLSFGQSSEKKSDDAKPAADLAAGKTVYEKRCTICHLASSDKKKIGPGLKGLGKRQAFANGSPVNDESLRTWIENGGKSMPGFKGILNAEQLRDLIAYLKTL
jgi:cytochrome c2